MRHLCARSRLVYIFIYPADRISLSFFFSPSLFLDRGRLVLWNLWMPRPRLAPHGDPEAMKMPSCAAVFQLQIQKLTNLIYCLRLIQGVQLLLLKILLWNKLAVKLFFTYVILQQALFSSYKKYTNYLKCIDNFLKESINLSILSKQSNINFIQIKKRSELLHLRYF